MSNLERVDNLKQIVAMVEPDFNQLAKIHGAVSFAREASFALQILKDSQYLTSIAMGDQDSFKRAIINVAAIGLSLSPVHKLAYLVPRKKKVCLDISYRGFIQLATDVGAIKWALAEVVCERDGFEIGGFGQAPIHRFNPFSDRGEVVGAYCVAKTHDGDFLTTVMSADEIISIRQRSESWKAYEADNSKTNPWLTDRNEMIKKTVIRRAYKSWPMTDTRKRFDQAIDVTNDFDAADPGPKVGAESRNDGLEKIRELLAALGRTEEKFLEHQIRVCRRDLKKIEDMTELETTEAIAMLTSFAEKAKTA